MRPRELDVIVEGYRYRTEISTLIAGDDYHDGNYERDGKNIFLYRTPNNRYFYVLQHVRQGVPDQLEPVSPQKAMSLYHRLPQHRVEFSQAFPGVKIRDA